MAKRARKVRKEEKEEVELPEFDERAYMRREIASARMALLAVPYAALVAVFSALLTAAGLSILAFFLGLLFMVALKPVAGLLGLKGEGFETKDWAAILAIFFFSWLVFWILALNPPFSDFSPPLVLQGVVSASDASSKLEGNQVSLNVTGPAANVTLTVNVTDNEGVASVTVSVDDGSPIAMTRVGSTASYSAVLPSLEEGSGYAVKVTSKDLRGNTTVREFTLTLT